MGDIIYFVAKAASIVDADEAEKTATNVKKGKSDLNDHLQQMSSIKMGRFGSILSMSPCSGKIMDQIDQSKLNSKIIEQEEGILLYMAPKECKNTDIIIASRRKRITAGAGTTVQKVNILLKQ